MRASVWLFPDHPVDGLVAAAETAEAAGLDAFWLGDEGVAREPFIALAAAARATRRIELGVAITNPYLRHPALTAATAATLAEWAGRRVHLGLGPGGSATLGPVGIRPVQRVEQLRRALRMARAVLGAQPTDEFTPSPFAWHAPEVALWIGGRGPRVAALAGELADGFFCNIAKPLVGDLLARARERGPILVALSFPVVLDEEQRESIRPYLPLALLDAPPGTARAAGMDSAAAQAAAAALARGDLAEAARHVTDEVLSNLVVGGSPHLAAAELAELATEHGADELSAAVWGRDLSREVERVAEVLLEATGRSRTPGDLTNPQLG